MEQTPHVMLVGPNALRWAIVQGFQEEETLTDDARQRWEEWKKNKTGPGVAHFGITSKKKKRGDGSGSHDTIGVLALDKTGNLAAGCTTSGLAWKIPGRVGDSPILGSGLYVDNAVGAASATGNGDEMMKVCLSFRVVSLMERGLGPQEACKEAIRYLLNKRPGAQGQGASVIALHKDGRIGSAATRDGFRPPDRLWHYAYTKDGKVIVVEGIYVDG